VLDEVSLQFKKRFNASRAKSARTGFSQASPLHFGSRGIEWQR